MLSYMYYAQMSCADVLRMSIDTCRKIGLQVGYWSSGTFALTVWAIQKRKADAVIATYSQAIPLENIFSLERRAHITGKRSSPSDRRRGSSLGDVVALKMRRNVSFLTHRSCHECVLLATLFSWSMKLWSKDLWFCAAFYTRKRSDFFWQDRPAEHPLIERSVLS